MLLEKAEHSNTYLHIRVSKHVDRLVGRQVCKYLVVYIEQSACMTGGLPTDNEVDLITGLLVRAKETSQDGLEAKL